MSLTGSQEEDGEVIVEVMASANPKRSIFSGCQNISSISMHRFAFTVQQRLASSQTTLNGFSPQSVLYGILKTYFIVQHTSYNQTIPTVTQRVATLPAGARALITL